MIAIQEVSLFSVASWNQHKAVTKFLMSRSFLLVGFYSNTFLFWTRCTVWWISRLRRWTTTTRYLSRQWDSSPTTASRSSSSSRTTACTVHQLCNSHPSTSCPPWTKSTSCCEGHSPREAVAASFTCMTLRHRSVRGDNPVTPETTGTPIGTHSYKTTV